MLTSVVAVMCFLYSPSGGVVHCTRFIGLWRRLVPQLCRPPTWAATVRVWFSQSK